MFEFRQGVAADFPKPGASGCATVGGGVFHVEHFGGQYPAHEASSCLAGASRFAPRCRPALQGSARLRRALAKCCASGMRAQPAKGPLGRAVSRLPP